jgi:3-hydroxyacyl-CoA dehydrogenase
MSMTQLTQSVRYETKGDTALVIVDNPPVNALSYHVRQGLKDGVEKAIADTAIKSIVIACEGRTFIAGADIREFGKPPKPPGLVETLEAMENSTKPVVAAVQGTALGGGFEVALACHARVLDAKAVVGLPEVKLGLIPGAGGTQRLPRIIGAMAALDMVTTGRQVKAKEALTLGLADKIAEGDLREDAIAYAKSLVGKPLRRAGALNVPAFDQAAFDAAVAAVKKKARGQLSPVVAAESVALAAKTDFVAGMKAERESFVRLIASDQSKALRYVFFAEREVTKVPHLEGIEPRKIETTGILGAGTMGAGIAISLINSGMPVTLVETKQEALDAGKKRILAVWERDVKLGRIAQDELEKRAARLTTTLDFNVLGTCDLVIEAVFEEMAIKKDVFGRLGKIAKPGAVLASNTSYLDIDQIGEASGRAADVIGMHFFSPANIMRLVEVIEGKKSTKDAVATGVLIGKRMGKLPVVCGNCDGFVGNRILAAWRLVTEFAIEDGAWPQEIDAALEAYGMAMGPFAVSDLAGLDIGMRRRKDNAHLRDPEQRYAYDIADELCQLGRFGQKTGAGYYKYVDGKRQVDPEVTAIIEGVSKKKNITRKSIPGEKVVEQVRAMMVNEAAKILDEGIAPRALDVDMVLLNGYGFPIWRGGPMHEADEIGLDKILATMREIHASYGKGFEPAPLLVKLAESGGKFADLKPSTAKAA